MDDVDEEDHRDMPDLTLELHDDMVQSDIDGHVDHPDIDDTSHKVAPTQDALFFSKKLLLHVQSTRCSYWTSC